MPCMQLWNSLVWRAFHLGGSCACKRIGQVYFEKPPAPHKQDGKEKCATFIIICAVQILVNWDWPAITRPVNLLACQTERCLKYAVWVNLANHAAHCCGKNVAVPLAMNVIIVFFQGPKSNEWLMCDPLVTDWFHTHVLLPPLWLKFHVNFKRQTQFIFYSFQQVNMEWFFLF